MGSWEEHENLVGEIVLALGSTDLCRVWPNPTGRAYRNGRPIDYGLPGSADILGILCNGLFLAIEVKTGKARQQANQKNFEVMIHRYNGIYLLCISVEDAELGVRRALE